VDGRLQHSFFEKAPDSRRSGCVPMFTVRTALPPMGLVPWKSCAVHPLLDFLDLQASSTRRELLHSPDYRRDSSGTHRPTGSEGGSLPSRLWPPETAENDVLPEITRRNIEFSYRAIRHGSRRTKAADGTASVVTIVCSPDLRQKMNTAVGQNTGEHRRVQR
jgi:hypothetical protein